MTAAAFTTERLLLEPISRELAARIVAKAPLPGDAPWHPDYPFADEVYPLRFLAAAADPPDPVFGMYQIRTRADGLAVGGIGFFGPPHDDDRVELGYGLVAPARGLGYATEALLAMIAIAQAHAVRLVAADTEADNAASLGVLRKAGFVEVRRERGAVFFEFVIPEEPSTSA